MSDQRYYQKAAHGSATYTPSTLGRIDWLQAAVTQFTEKGIGAVKITRLANQLNVTRGSFYWHFKNRQELLQAIVLFWSQKNSQSIMAAVQNVNNLEEGIIALYSCWLDPNQFDPKLDLAMRDWARHEKKIKDQVLSADRNCIHAISQFFIRLGVEKVEAMTRARTIYFCQVGYYMLGLEESMEQRLQYLEDTVSILAGHPLSAESAKRFRKQHGL